MSKEIIYINNFVEDLNYKKIILWVGGVDPDRLREKLEQDDVNHIYDFKYVLENNFMYIENCDLQYIDDSWENISDYLREGYIILPLYHNKICDDFYIENNLYYLT